MHQHEIEQLAENVYRNAGLSPETPVSPILLARKLLAGGRRHVVFERDDLEVKSLIEDGPPRIIVRSGLSERAQAWLVASELARLELSDEEDVRRLAACLRAPRAALEGLVWDGASVSEIAEYCDISETSALLRLGEALGEPVGLITSSGLVRFRGERGPRRIRWTRVPLSDHASRVALVAAS